MYNDTNFQIRLLQLHGGNEQKAFRWLFAPINHLNHRTPFEVISDGGRARVFGYITALLTQKEEENDV